MSPRRRLDDDEQPPLDAGGETLPLRPDEPHPEAADPDDWIDPYEEFGGEAAP